MRALGVRLIFTLVLLLAVALLFAVSMAAAHTPAPGRAAHEAAAPAATPAAPTPAARPADTSPSAPLSDSFLGAGSKLLIVSLILAGLLYVAMRLMRRLPLARFLPNGDGPIRVVARTHLGAKESLCLVEVGSTALLLGVTAQGMQTLHVWPDGRSGSTGASPGAPAPRGMAPISVPGQLRTLETRLFGTRR